MRNTEKVTLTLPKTLMDEVRNRVPGRGQSKFIAEAVAYFIEVSQQKSLRERLIAGYQANATADSLITSEWQAADDETWATVPTDEGEEPDYDPTHPTG